MYDEKRQTELTELRAAIAGFTERNLAQGSKVKFISEMAWTEAPSTLLAKEMAFTSAQIFCEKCDRYIDLNFESNCCAQCGGDLDSYYRVPVGVFWGAGNLVQ